MNRTLNFRRRNCYNGHGDLLQHLLLRHCSLVTLLFHCVICFHSRPTMEHLRWVTLGLYSIKALLALRLTNLFRWMVEYRKMLDAHRGWKWHCDQSTSESKGDIGTSWRILEVIYLRYFWIRDAKIYSFLAIESCKSMVASNMAWETFNWKWQGLCLVDGSSSTWLYGEAYTRVDTLSGSLPCSHTPSC